MAGDETATPDSNTARRWPARNLQAGAAAVFAVLGVAFVDYQLTSSRLPILPADFMASDPERIARGDLQNGYVDRAWIYSLLIIAVIGIVVFLTARATPAERRRPLFTDLGVAGVLSAFIAAAITASGPYLLDPSSKVMLWLPTLAMLATAAIGSVLTNDDATAGAGPPRLPSPTEDTRPPLARLGRNALGLSVIAIVLLSIGSTGVACGAESSGGSGTLLIAALILGVIVGVIGFAALFVRRWVLASLAILFPLLILFGIASAIGPCLS